MVDWKKFVCKGCGRKSRNLRVGYVTGDDPKDRWVRVECMKCSRTLFYNGA